MSEQFNLLGLERFRIDKPLRLIELFSGYGSQALALKYLGVPFESWKTSEWAIKSIQAYKDMHHYDDNTDYSNTKTDDELRRFFYNGRISKDYSNPLSDKDIDKIPVKELRTIYNNMMASRNLGSICLIHGEDLNIVDTDKYTYVAFYSFPCQDLSNSGKKLGMSKDSGTRSGMLWQFERILTELKDNGMALPQVLIMENVPEVMGKKNEKDFDRWLYRLEDFGYQNFAKILNAKDFSIPQSRNRCFMVSVLGGYDYIFPDGRPNKYRLRDFCDCGVDESYYLSPEQIQVFEEHKQKQKEKGNTFGWRSTKGDGIAQCIKAHGQNCADDTFLEEDIGGGYANTIRCGGAGSLDRHSWDIFEEQRTNSIGESRPNGGDDTSASVKRSDGFQEAIRQRSDGNLSHGGCKTMNDGDGFRYDVSQKFGGTRVFDQTAPTLLSGNFSVGVCMNEQNKEDR